MIRISKEMSGKGIAFYDFKGQKFDLKSLYEAILPYAELFGVEWTSIELEKSNKMLQFKSGHKRLEKHGFNVTSYIALYGGQSEKGVNNDWSISASLYPRTSKVYFCFNDAKENPLKKDFVKEVIHDIAPHLGFNYGIGLERMNTSSDPHISGYSTDSMTQEDRDKTTKWRNKYIFDDGNYQTGDLRDIYPFNILTQTHLSRKIKETQTLEQWIAQSPAHGELEKVTDRHYLWSVAEENINAVQEALDPSGILLCYKV